MDLLLAHERFSKIKQAFREEQHKQENIQELLRKLLNDLQVLNEILLERGEHAAQISTLNWKCPVFYDDDDEFDDEYISSDVNPLFDEVLEDIECKDSYDSNLDESTFLVTPLFNSKEDEYFTPGDDVELLLHRDPSTPIMSVASLLEGFTDELPLEENDDLFYLESKNDKWKMILYNAPIDDLITEDKVFDPGIHDQFFSPTYVSLPFMDRYYIFFTYVVQIFLPHFTYPVVSPFLLLSGSEDTIFDPGIFAFHFSHRSRTFISFNVYPNILNESRMEIFSSTCFNPNITMIRDDNIISGLPLFFAITPNEPVLSTEEPDNSLSMGDEHLDTIPAMKSNEFIKSGDENLIPIPSEFEGIPEHMCDVPSHDNSLPLDVSKDQIKDLSEFNEEFSSIDDDSFSSDDIDYVEASPPDSELVSSEVIEIVIPKVGGIDDGILLIIKYDVLREKLLNVNLLIAKIEALNANPTPSFDCTTKSPSTSFNSLLEDTNTFDNSLPEFETFCFDVEEISSGSNTTHPDISLPKYEAFYDDHVKEISSGSPTTHFYSSLYASFIFDLSINPFPPVDRSDFYEFTDELIPFISPPEYDCFLFKVEPNSGDFTKDVVEDISPTKEPQVRNTLPTHPFLQLNMKFQPSSKYLFTYVVWIFLLFLVYSVVPHYLLSLRNEDAIFDPGICNSTFSRPHISHRGGTVKIFNTHRSHLNKCPMM
uniref:Reverse transcriptase domain-containing protein n=1 Tax=Tanacetum cinerariifolium TaxID=118510 RepID=A0A6L2P255_TANCI|nr:hypothetical protein [Tanacetum cinerariifolium]